MGSVSRVVRFGPFHRRENAGGNGLKCSTLFVILLASPWMAWAQEKVTEMVVSRDTPKPLSALILSTPDTSDPLSAPVLLPPGANPLSDLILPTPDTPNPLAAPIPPIVVETHKTVTSKPPGVRWKSLLNQSFRFLVFENAFRYATEEGTRDPDRPYFQGYIDSVGALHGWADGDPFYVNYVGHPMQGAVAGYIWTLNDTKYQYVQFGKSPEYWKSRIRATAFSWAYSEWTEIGPFMSEAAIGNIQASFPQWGFVDHVVTPAIGMGWMIAEDAMDQYVVRYVERRTHNRVVRDLVRGGANPARSLANALAFRKPWDRPRDHGEMMVAQAKTEKGQETERQPGVAPFEFTANAYGFDGPTGSCAGGGATAAFRISAEWQAVVDINGCKMNALQRNLTGDSLAYTAGARWTPPVSGRLVPYLQVLVGGNKLTQELMFPAKEAYLEALAASTGSPPPDHYEYTKQFEHDGFMIAAGGGLDLHFNRALGFRLFGLEYTRSWVDDMPGFKSPNGFQVKAGVILRMGNW